MHLTRHQFVGLDEPLPLLDGRRVRHVHLDNAASTPVLRAVLDAVTHFLPYYSSVHRGRGFKSRLSTAAYDEAHEAIARFVHADPRAHTVIFGKNTTEAINKMAARYPLTPQSVVLSSEMEHHSNDLPWRRRADVVRARILPDGRLDEADMDRLLALHGERVALIAISGASNVTGFVQPIHRLARKAHAVGARILVDAAQLAPHRAIDMRPVDDPEHLDYVVLSAHKMYAPFGTGALIGRRDTFLDGAPDHVGGGTVDTVTPTEVRWAGLPDREEAGSPNVVGAIAMAAAANTLSSIGFDRLARHEAALTAHALKTLDAVPGVTVYPTSSPTSDRAAPDAGTGTRLGVVPFNVEGMPHAMVAAILGYEGGIAVRSGCFCAQQYVAQLLGLTGGDADGMRRARLSGLHHNRPGMVRASLGAANTAADINALGEMLWRIARRDYDGTYRQDAETGDYAPAGWVDPLAQYFSLSSPCVRLAG
jgi:cysteine desulfurase/selenocysteine lyase